MLRTSLVLITFFYSFSSFAAIQIMATRVILDAKEKEQSFVIRNTGEVPSLLQIWLSEKDEEGMNISNNIPLTITPPVSRINVNKSKVFRLFPTDEAMTALPQDRESVFWINALDVPSVNDSDDKMNKLDIAFRTRIKVFYRPLNMTGTLIEAAERIKWEVKSKNNRLIYTASNQSPFHISFANLSLTANGKKITDLPGSMLDPYSSKEFVFDKFSETAAELNYNYITDLGAFVQKTFKS